MKLNPVASLIKFLSAKLATALSLSALLLSPISAHASVAYGSFNNFDTVNDTGVEAHGVEIEIDDIHSTNITYTYDYNHYGLPPNFRLRAHYECQPQKQQQCANHPRR